MSDFPYMQFFAGDWTSDPKLSACSPATRGIWMDTLCAMHASGRAGELSGTTHQLARICRCLPAEMSTAIADLRTTGAADVTERNGVVTLTCRRMKRDCNKRTLCSQRVKKCRNGGVAPEPASDKRGSNAGVTDTRALNPEDRDQKPEPPNPQPQTAGGGEAEEELPREQTWQRVCRVVRRDPAKPKSVLEMQMLEQAAGINEEDMQVVERFAVAQQTRGQGEPKGKWLAHTLLAEFHAEVGKARLWLEHQGIVIKPKAATPTVWPAGFEEWRAASDYANAPWSDWSQVPSYARREFEQAAKYPAPSHA